MSTDARQPDDDQDATEPAVANGSQDANVPVRPNEPEPTDHSELSELKQQRLVKLFDRANAAHDQARVAALNFCQYSLDAGAALLQAKDLCPKGTWLEWLEKCFKASARTAQRYVSFAKLVLQPMGGDATDLSHLPQEELARLLANAVRRIQRERLVAYTGSEAPRSAATVGAPGDLAPAAIGCSLESPEADDDLLAKIVALFDELDAALRRAIQSSEWLDYGPFILDELERLRADLEACRVLVSDCRLETRRSV